jgi:hypothetical protein
MHSSPQQSKTQAHIPRIPCPNGRFAATEIAVGTTAYGRDVGPPQRIAVSAAAGAPRCDLLAEAGL